MKGNSQQGLEHTEVTPKVVLSRYIKKVLLCLAMILFMLPLIFFGCGILFLLALVCLAPLSSQDLIIVSMICGSFALIAFYCGSWFRDMLRHD
jgi:hypothetical protein